MATNEQTEQQEEEGGQNISTMDMNITKHKKKRDQNNKRNKKKSGIRFGDLDFKVEQLEFMEQVDTASWQEVVHACCFHDGQEWLGIAGGILLLAACLYFFLFGLGLLGNAAQVLAGCKAGELFGDDNSNPLSSLMTGILATVMMQSSSTTTAIIVSLLEVKALNIQHGIYLVMGANIGTTVTSTIVSIAHMRKPEELERAFAAATVHDMFNMMTVAVLFPLECATGYLQALTGALTDGAETSRSEPWEGPLKKFVSPLVNKLIVSNKKVMEGVALGGHCSDFYPIQCDPGAAPSYDTCKTGLIACDKTTNECPAFFRESASQGQDQVAGAVCFLVAIFIMFLCVAAMMYVIQKLLFGLTTKVVYTVTHCNGYLGILFGTGITLITQSSSVTTSLLVPFAGVGALRQQQMYPLVLGANMGTAIQTVIGAMDKAGTDPLQVALAHLFFNVTGILLWYPLPWLREVPMYAATRLGRGAAIWRFFPLVYICLAFVVGPIFLEVLGVMFDGSTGQVVGASLITACSTIALFFLIWWCKFAGGDKRYVDFISKRGDDGDGDTGKEEEVVAVEPETTLDIQEKV